MTEQIWQCGGCGRTFGEYVNGCPHHGDVEIAPRVELVGRTSSRVVSADRLREAARALREQAANGDYSIDPDLGLALADWLDTAGADLWAYGPLHCADGCMVCDDELWQPHARRALALADLILGAES